MKVFVAVVLIALFVACDAGRVHRRKARFHQPASHGSPSARIDESPQPYEFEYAIKDAPTNNDYAHQQVSDGRVVTGSYRVLLPDGRTQIVTYRADENGYVAKVRYEGEAIFPPTPSFSSGVSSAAYSAKY